MKRIIAALLLVSYIMTLHSGKTDSNGGHWDYSTGTYHYHHGYPAHQHENGICPYNPNYKASGTQAEYRSPSTNSSASGSSKTTRSVVAAETKESKPKNNLSLLWLIPIVFLFSPLGWCIDFLVFEGVKSCVQSVKGKFHRKGGDPDEKPKRLRWNR